MLKKITRVLFGAGLFAAIALPAKAQTVVTPNLQGLQTQLQQEVCSQQWAEAISTIDQILVTPTQWGLGHREQFSDYRETLVGYEQTQARFDVIPGCGSTTSSGQWERAAQSIEAGASARRRASNASMAAQSVEIDRVSGLGEVAYAIAYCEAKEQGKTDRQAGTAAVNDAFDFLVASGVPTDRMDEAWFTRAYEEQMERCPES